MDKDQILARLRSVEMLPTFPQVVSGLLKVIDDPLSSASDIAKHMDPSMVGEVLRIANSAYFGTRSFGNISTLEHAIAVIGYEHLTHTILQMPFIGMIGSDESFDRKRFVSHSIACGAASKALSVVMALGDPNEVYLGGILHDVGNIVMYRFFREEWLAAIALTEGDKMSRLDAEEAVFSADHGWVGAALLELWNIPKPITESVMFHHFPEKAVENGPNVTVVSTGNRFCKEIDFLADLESFDDFVIKHRGAVQEIRRSDAGISPSEEVSMLENLYIQLREVKGYVESVVEGENG